MLSFGLVVILLLFAYIGGLIFGVSVGRPPMRSSSYYRPHMRDDERYR